MCSINNLSRMLHTEDVFQDIIITVSVQILPIFLEKNSDTDDVLGRFNSCLKELPHTPVCP